MTKDQTPAPPPVDVEAEGVKLTIRSVIKRAEMLRARAEAAEARLAELEGLLEPGTAPAIINAMFDAAIERGHPKWSSSHALNFFIERSDRLEEAEARAARAEQRLAELVSALDADNAARKRWSQGKVADKALRDTERVVVTAIVQARAALAPGGEGSS